MGCLTLSLFVYPVSWWVGIDGSGVSMSVTQHIINEVALHWDSDCLLVGVT